MFVVIFLENSQRVKTFWGKYTQVEHNYGRSIHDTASYHKFDYSYCVKWFKNDFKIY